MLYYGALISFKLITYISTYIHSAVSMDSNQHDEHREDHQTFTTEKVKTTTTTTNHDENGKSAAPVAAAVELTTVMGQYNCKNNFDNLMGSAEAAKNGEACSLASPKTSSLASPPAPGSSSNTSSGHDCQSSSTSSLSLSFPSTTTPTTTTATTTANTLTTSVSDYSLSTDVEQEVLDEEPRNIIYAMLSQLTRGMDLHRVSFPTFVLEPRSLLERITDFMAHPQFVIK